MFLERVDVMDEWRAKVEDIVGSDIGAARQSAGIGEPS